MDIAIKPYDVVIFIGRFQPVHNGHLAVFEQAAMLAKIVIGLVGSAEQPRSVKNPFTAEERMQMLHQALKYPLQQHQAKLYTQPLPDTLESDTIWAQTVHKQAQQAMQEAGITQPQKIALIGYEKDDSSYYLHLFPQWTYVAVSPVYMNAQILNATQIRDAMYQGQILHSVLPGASQSAIKTLLATPEGQALCAKAATAK